MILERHVPTDRDRKIVEILAGAAVQAREIGKLLNISREAHLRRVLRAIARYYDDIRTHQALDEDAPASRSVQRTGIIRSRAILGGLHHHYVRV